ncbi:MAG: hypothetical protein P857_1075 [Candidatus Xenolissoclinum pacificiensis L6]|uniref:Uncharacterized protein n=1 Tax=Candidatus Xenolissoclinum pacificiensis L6 TaxID=1401685 RepID=W2V1A3_9RICK|nr:MAG: hypothetical protein P857_1075 [Candidatus Xenolissoclinum pacificiensis L6]
MKNRLTDSIGDQLTKLCRASKAGLVKEMVPGMKVYNEIQNMNLDEYDAMQEKLSNINHNKH